MTRKKHKFSQRYRIGVDYSSHRRQRNIKITQRLSTSARIAHELPRDTEIECSMCGKPADFVDATGKAWCHRCSYVWNH